MSNVHQPLLLENPPCHDCGTVVQGPRKAWRKLDNLKKRPDGTHLMEEHILCEDCYKKWKQQ